MFRKSHCWVLLFLVACSTHYTYGSTALDPDYTAELFCSYNQTGHGNPKYLAFDSSGYLYITHDRISSNPGTIFRIAPDKTVTTFVTGLSNSQGIVWGGDTSFGNNLYVANNYSSTIVSVRGSALWILA